MKSENSIYLPKNFFFSFKKFRNTKKFFLNQWKHQFHMKIQKKLILEIISVEPGNFNFPSKKTFFQFQKNSKSLQKFFFISGGRIPGIHK